MVAMCSCCAVIEIWSAVFFIAPLAVVVFYSLQDLLLKMQVDDPLGASSLHWGPGCVGMFVVGFFAKPEYVDLVYGCKFDWARGDDTCDDYYGIFYGGTGKQLGIQIMAIFIYTIYGLITCGLMFYLMSRAGILRISREEELAGMDTSHHGGLAYSWIRGEEEVSLEDGTVQKTVSKEVVSMVPTKPASTSQLASNM